MNRIKNKFDELNKRNKKGLGIFLTAGYPNLKDSEDILLKLPNIGVDFIEIGMPFSDPMADGPLIQESSEVSLNNGMNIKKCFDTVSKIRLKDTKIPIILMGYYNPIFIYGNNKFIKNAKKVGVDGLIIVDLPFEEDAEFYFQSEESNLHVIRLITPTTDFRRLKKITRNSKGFIYYVSVTGITGTKSANIKSVKKKMKLLRSMTDLPIIVGFGIKTPTQAVEMSENADGIVIGSTIVEVIKKTHSSKIVNKCINFIKTFSKKLWN